MEREKRPVLARSVIDDVKDWWNSPSETVAKRAPRPEKPFTKQDLDQTLALVNQPVAAALQEIGGKPDRFKWQSAASKLGPAANSLKVIASHKKEAANQATILAAVPHIEKAQTTLQVLGDIMAAQQIWIDAFNQALAAVDKALSAPVIDPDAAKDADNADPPPADGVFKRDHELIEASVKPTLQRLIAKTAGPVYQSWTPHELPEIDETMTALGAVDAKQLAAAKAAVEKGRHAIDVFKGDLEKSLADAKVDLETALSKVATAAGPYFQAPPEEQ